MHEKINRWRNLFLFFLSILNLKPVEFCSDVFLLPLGMPQVDSIDLRSNTYIRHPRPEPPSPPIRVIPAQFAGQPDQTPITLPKDLSYHDILADKLEFNNNLYVESVLNNNNNIIIKGEEEELSKTAVIKQHQHKRLTPPIPPPRTVLEPIFESHESDQIL